MSSLVILQNVAVKFFRCLKNRQTAVKTAPLPATAVGVANNGNVFLFLLITPQKTDTDKLNLRISTFE